MSVLAILAFFGLAVVLGIGFLKLMDLWGAWRARRRVRRHPETQPGTPEYTARLLNPRVEELEAHFGRPLPVTLRRLHQDAELLQRGDFYMAPPGARKFAEAWHIAFFVPADLRALDEVFPVGPLNVPFASDGFGDVYYLALGERNAEDGPVYIYRHDGDDREPVAGSLAEFLSWRRLTPEQAERLGS